MSVTMSFENGLQKAFTPTAHGIVGLVDQVLAFCRIRGAVFEWRDGLCHCRPLEGEGEPVEIPLHKSAFRTILARVAALCNEHKADSVSPYGGVGNIDAGGDPPQTLRVTFTNTPDTQILEVSEGRNEALEKVLTLFRQVDRTTKEDRLIRDILALGPEAVASIRDPRNWASLEHVLDGWSWVTQRTMLAIAGAPLAVHWYSSLSSDLAEEAKSWARKNWRASWDALTDPMKRGLVEHFELWMRSAEAHFMGAEMIARHMGKMSESRREA